MMPEGRQLSPDANFVIGLHMSHVYALHESMVETLVECFKGKRLRL